MSQSTLIYVSPMGPPLDFDPFHVIFRNLSWDILDSIVHYSSTFLWPRLWLSWNPCKIRLASWATEWHYFQTLFENFGIKSCTYLIFFGSNKSPQPCYCARKIFWLKKVAEKSYSLKHFWCRLLSIQYIFQR